MENVIDTTGCGDSFAGGLAYGLMDGGDNFIRSAMYANALGAQRTPGHYIRSIQVFARDGRHDEK